MADSNQPTTIIASDTHVNGEMTFENAAVVRGRLDGKIVARGELHVAEGGRCRADIEAADVRVDGQIEGNITASGRVQLNASSRVQGDIVAQRLVTTEGASISGRISVGKSAGRPSPDARPPASGGGKPGGQAQPAPQPAGAGKSG